jgi:hypothetical protein
LKPNPAAKAEVWKNFSLIYERNVDVDVDPLMFWKDQVAEFPILAEVARRVFCISASSAQSERDFSSVGNTITHVRSRLAPHKVEAIELVKWGWRAGLLHKK